MVSSVRPIRAYTIPKPGSAPPGGPSGGDWSELQDDVAKIKTRVFDVREYGAAGNGVADDTAEINAAIAAAVAAGGGEVFFASGTYLISPTTAAWLTLASNITYSGVGYASCIKVKADAGNYSSVFRPPTEGTRVENVVFRDLRIDQNAAAQTTATAPLTGVTHAQLAVAAWNCQNITVDRCWFDDCTGVNTVYLNGAGFSDVTDLSVLNNTFRWALLPNATNPSPEHRAFDNSAIYVVGTVATIEGNHFYADPADGARGACELHGPHMTYTGNMVIGYQTLLNMGSMWVGVDYSADWVVTHNVGYDLNNAFVITSGDGNTTDRLVVAHNILHHDTTQHALALGWGISIGGDVVNDGTFAELDISHNLIHYVPDNRTTTWTGANITATADSIYFSGIRLAVASTLKYGRLAFNTIVNAPTHGITIGDQAVGVVSFLDTHHNTIVDCGLMQTTFPLTPAYINVQGDVRDCWLHDNTIIDNGSGAAIGYFSYRASSVINLLNATRLRIDEGPILGTGASFLQTWGYAPTELNRDRAKSTIAPGTINSATTYSTTVAMLGAKTTDTVTAHPAAGIEDGLFYYAYISAANTVTVKIRNNTAGNIAAVSQTWRFRLHRTELDV
jgi:hypothetical protein